MVGAGRQFLGPCRAPGPVFELLVWCGVDVGFGFDVVPLEQRASATRRWSWAGHKVFLFRILDRRTKTSFFVQGPLNGQPVECQDITRHVADHFHCRNDLHGIKAVGEPFGIEIEVWVEQFTHATRGAYFDRVLSKIGSPATPTVWFFDPDTGIEPESGASGKHVRLQELSDAFKKLPPGDWLVCYQHGKREQDWRTQARTRLSKQLGRHESKVEVFTSDYPKDAIILAVEK